MEVRRAKNFRTPVQPVRKMLQYAAKNPDPVRSDRAFPKFIQENKAARGRVAEGLIDLDNVAKKGGLVFGDGFACLDAGEDAIGVADDRGFGRYKGAFLKATKISFAWT